MSYNSHLLQSGLFPKEENTLHQQTDVLTNDNPDVLKCILTVLQLLSWNGGHTMCELIVVKVSPLRTQL